MSVYSFEVTLDGPLTEERVEALFEAGCGDMTFVGDASGGLAVVHRDASNVVAAVLSAVTDIEKVPGLAVLGVANLEMVSRDLILAINATLQIRRMVGHFTEQERLALRTLLFWEAD